MFVPRWEEPGMITRFIRADDYVGPADLAMLQGVLEELCRREQIARRSAAADQLAKRVILLYKAGARERSKFLTMITTKTRRAS